MQKRFLQRIVFLSLISSILMLTGVYGQDQAFIKNYEPSQAGGVVKITTGINNFPNILGSDHFGSSVVNVGDLDGDGVADLAVGAYSESIVTGTTGRVYILYMKDDGTVKGYNQLTTPTGAYNFGISIANMGDVNGDGVIDLAVGANGDAYGGTGVGFSGDVYICFLKKTVVGSNVTMSIIAAKTQKIVGSSLTGASSAQKISGPQFGYRVANMGDYDGDGINDLLVGAPQDKNGFSTTTGSVFVITLKSDGTVKKSYRISNSSASFSGYLTGGDNFGSAVDGIGDFDGDGVPDIAVGNVTCSDVNSKSGCVYILNLNSGTGASAGTVKAVTKISDSTAGLYNVFGTGELFGSSVSCIKNFGYNKNAYRSYGVRVLLVGSTGDNDYIKNGGAAWLIYLDSASNKVLSYQKISGKNAALKASGNNVNGNGQFGYSVCNYSTRDTNSIQRILIGAPNDSGNTAPGTGAFYILDVRKFQLKADSILFPSDTVCANSVQKIGIVFENWSNAAIYAVPKFVNGTGTAKFSLADTSFKVKGIQPGEKDTVYFKVNLPTNKSGTITLNSYVKYPGDFYAHDDTTTRNTYVLGALTVPTFGKDTIYLCKGQTQTLDLLNSTAHYKWYQNGSQIAGSTGETYTVTTAGNYVGIAQLGSCVTSDTMQVFYRKSASVSLGPDQKLCYGDSTTLSTGYPGTSHSWIDYTDPANPIPVDTNQSIKIKTNSSATYIGTVTYNHQCTYSDTINIIYNHVVVNLGVDTILCDGQSYKLDAQNPGSAYTWYKDGVSQGINTSTNTVTASGTYSVVVKNGNCFGTDSVKVKFLAMPTVSITPKFDTLCKGLTKILNAGNPGFKHTWFKNGANLNLADTTSTNKVTNDGLYKVLVSNTTRAKCFAKDSETVTYNILSVSLGLPPSLTLCQGAVQQMTAKISTTVGNKQFYQWYKDGVKRGTTSIDSIKSAGKYWVVVNVGNCTASDTVNVKYTPITQPNFGHKDTLLCQGTTITLNPNNTGATFSWTTPKGPKSSQTVTVDSAGTYNVLVTNGNCSRDTFINVTYTHMLVTLGKDTTLCFGRPVTFDAKNTAYNATYQWYDDGAVIAGATNRKYSPVQTGTFKVMVFQRYCTDSGHVHVSFLPSPIVVHVDTTVCSEDTITLDAGNVGSKIIWSTGARTQTIRVHKTLSPTAVRKYKAYITNGGCTDTSVFNISYYAPMVLNLRKNIFLCDSLIDGVVLDAGGAASYDWEPTGDKTRRITVTSPGKYSVTIKNIGGCSITDSTRVFECPPSEVLIPNAFTPDDKPDGLNDTFKIYNLNASQFLLKIYNRWGEEVFTSQSVNKGWDGKKNGSPVPEGVYKWTLIYRLKTATGTPPEKIITGTVTVFRH